MAKELRTEIEIDAAPDRVWRVFSDFASFPEWNPFVRKASGDLNEGAKLEVQLQLNESRSMTFSPTVVRAEPNREFRWAGHMGMPGLFDGEHRFVIEPLDGNRARFVQAERFTGVLVPLIMLMVEKDTQRGFEAMNQALKERAEAGAKS